MYKRCIKRKLDCILALIGLMILWLPMLIIAASIKIDSAGSVIYKQERLGYRGKKFTIYKFRTMVMNAYEIGGVATRSDDARITRVGAFLRRTSLDELPQMINILKGDMAIIGPRPILPVEFKEYRHNKLYCRRYSVLPGLFCTVDVDMRASADRDTQFQMDAGYAKNITFKTDLVTLLKVAKTVITGKNVYKEEIK